MTKKLPFSIAQFKKRAKEIAKTTGLQQTKALDQLSREYHFNNWEEVVKIDNDSKLIKSNKTKLSPDAHNQNQAYLKILKNEAFLVKLGIQFTTVHLTPTMLQKSIIDAVALIRHHFSKSGFHDYDSQPQGTINKVLKKYLYLSSTETKPKKISMYRPDSKQGDPRLCFYGLKRLAKAEDAIAIFILGDMAFVLNLSTVDLTLEYKNKSSFISLTLSKYIYDNNDTAQELFNKLKAIASEPLIAINKGDTAIGMAIEHKLGIQANSDKAPDYKGIELKSTRLKSNKRQNRVTLFAQVANWKISDCKSSKEILTKYGYQREDDFKLYCTVASNKHNSQGLSFQYNASKDLLEEQHTPIKTKLINDKEEKSTSVAFWSGEILRERLREKHAETFWINAESTFINGIEHFHLKSIIHTKAPMENRLLPLIEAGIITMDHLIKQSGKTGRVSEKGPLFKIAKQNLGLLFPDPVEYSLID